MARQQTAVRRQQTAVRRQQTADRMNQAEVHKLIHALRLKVSPRANNVRSRFQPRAPSGALAQGGNRYQLELTRQ